MVLLFAALVTAWLVLGVPGEAQAATLHVANHGEDTPGCGTRREPCRSISAAIGHASEGDRIVVGPGLYGDVNGDGGFDDPGDEAAELQPPGCACMIHVDKARLTLESEAGAGATVLHAAGRSIAVVRITAGDVTFGTRNKGFTVAGGDVGLVFGARGVGVTVESNRFVANASAGLANLNSEVFGRLEVVDNIASDNGVGFQDGGNPHSIYRDNVAVDNRRSGFLFASNFGLIKGNTASQNGEQGFEVGHLLIADVELRDNAATGNRGSGFWFTGFAALRVLLASNFAGGNGGAGIRIQHLHDSTVIRNVAGTNGGHGFEMTASGVEFRENTASANRGSGFALLADGGVRFHRNAAVGNGLAGIRLEGGGAVDVHESNLVGNIEGNCGLISATDRPITATRNFWGASTGPGADPADQVCPVGASETIVEPFATRPFTIPVEAGR